MTDDLLRTIEICVQLGKPCLIENVGTEVDASLDSILTRAFKHAGQPSIKIGENAVAYNFDFRLYLITRLPNPLYTLYIPNVAIKVLIVNFTLTTR